MYIISTKQSVFFLCYIYIEEMELLPEGKNFRLAQEDELPEILEFLSNFLPDALKVRVVLIYLF